MGTHTPDFILFVFVTNNHVHLVTGNNIALSYPGIALTVVMGLPTRRAGVMSKCVSEFFVLQPATFHVQDPVGMF